MRSIIKICLVLGMLLIKFLIFTLIVLIAGFVKTKILHPGCRFIVNVTEFLNKIFINKEKVSENVKNV